MVESLRNKMRLCCYRFLIRFLPCFSRGSIYLSSRPLSIHFSYQEFVDLNRLLWYRGIPRNRCRLRYGTPECQSAICKYQEFKKHQSRYWRSKRTPHSSLLASADENVTVNCTSQPTSRSELEGIGAKFEQSLEDDDTSSRLVQALHDAARAIELAITEHSSSVKSSWFSKAWIGVDRNGWIKTFSYQAAIYSLLQAAIEISSRGDGRDRDVNVFVQRSLMRQSVPLETMIRDELSAKQLSVYDWFWSQQYPAVVTTFVNLLERDPQFAAATAICWKGVSSGSSRAHDLSLLMLALSCIAAVTKLGPAKVSCTQFFSIVPDVTGRLMDMLVDSVSIWKAYYSVKDIGLRREFLLHFGPRAASCRVKNDQGVEDISFWVELVQKQLQRALDREKIWSRLTTCESIEVLEKDLAIFGFFIALGRSTQTFLSTNGFTEIEKPIESFISYLIGGSALYYPQLSSISSYQLYVEVVCEELEWLPFYQRNLVDHKHSHESKGSEKGLPQGEAVSQVLEVCSHWMKSFIKYSAWLENPSNIKAARFLSRGHSMLEECRRDLGIRKNEVNDNTLHENEKCTSETSSPGESELDSFGKALESVEEALSKLEQLLQELHLSNLNHGKEHLKAACSDLERIRKLKKEAEFLEASFRAKAASLEEEVGDGQVPSKRPYTKRKREKNNEFESDGSPIDGTNTKSHGLWSFLAHHSTRRSNAGSRTTDDKEGDPIEGTTSCSQSEQSAELNEIRRFELLRRELIELEKRVQRSTDGTQDEEELHIVDKGKDLLYQNGEHVVPQVQKKENILAKSIDKLKKTSTDVWQGTQLLAIDVAAATVLLKRGLTGDELSEKEKKALRRTLTDLASVVPIGFLMLLPVTAVGHAAMLAAIQRYAPGLIPSTYAPDRLDLLRQLEKVKEMETVEGSSEENVEAKFLS